MYDTLISAPGGPRAIRMREGQNLAPGAGAALLHDGFRLVGVATDLPLLEGRRAVVGGQQLSVFRLPDRYVALAAVCPHTHDTPEAGRVVDGHACCPRHHWRVDLATGAVASAQDAARRHEVLERDGLLYIRAQAQEAGA